MPYLNRKIEDYAVVYFGSSLFKILRLLVIAIFSVHFFACIFYRVKEVSAESSDDVVDFYVSRHADEVVRFIDWSSSRSKRLCLFKQSDTGFVSELGRVSPINM
jgi:hypothetical protein